MIDKRKQGLLSLQTVIGVLAKLLAFMACSWVMVHWVGSVEHDYINYPLYLVGIIASSLTAHYRLVHQQMQNEESNRWVRAVRRTNGDTLFTALFLFAIVWATKDNSISRILLGAYLMISWILVLFNHLMMRDALARLLFRGRNHTRTAFIGSSASAQSISEWLGNAEQLGMHIVGIILPKGDKTATPGRLPLLGHDDDLANVIEQHGLQQVILLETMTSRTWVEAITSTCVAEGCRMLVFNPWQEYFSQSLRTVSEAGHTFFTIQPEPLEDPINRILKRLIDVAISLPLIVFILPIFSILVWLVQLKQSPGPLLYRQKRSGLFGDTFDIYKFRSMHVRPPDTDEAQQATKGDPRIYPFGRFLRKTSIDELPQLINVLLGHMSLVGPRPHLTSHDEWFRQHAGAYKTRQFVKPGITGLAQVRGMRGEVQNPDQIRQRVKLDIQYINTWSVWMDIGILAKTALILLKPPPEAY